VEQKNAVWSQLGRVAFHMQAFANHVKNYTPIVCKTLQGKNLQVYAAFTGDVIYIWEFSFAGLVF
jgi:hypothetical protein